MLRGEEFLIVDLDWPIPRSSSPWLLSSLNLMMPQSNYCAAREKALSLAENGSGQAYLPAHPSPPPINASKSSKQVL